MAIDLMILYLSVLNIEVWRPLLGAEDHYEVSNLGRVASKDQTLPAKNGSYRFKKGIIRKICSDKDGYNVVDLTINYKTKRCRVGRSVLEAFDPRDDFQEHEVDHIYGDRSEDRLHYLRWLSISGNRRNLHFTTKAKSGVRGVRFRKEMSLPWEARASVDNKSITLGTFFTKEEAINCRRQFEDNIYG